jgi:uncharacterized membrane protein
MINIFARIQRPSLRWGLIFGVILGIAEVGYNFTASFITDASLLAILGYIPALLLIFIGFYAGLRASRETGKWTSGLAAGIWVGVIAAVIFYLIPMINTFVNLQAMIASGQLYFKTHPQPGFNPSSYGASDVIITQLEVWLSLVAEFALFTLVSSALGGFVGRRRSLAMAVSQEQEEAVSEADIEAEETETEEVKDEAAK